MVDALRTFPARRGGKWIVLVAWLVAAGALGSLQPKLQDATRDDPASFLPGSAESTKVLHSLEDRFRAGRSTPALVVYRRDGGLTPADRAAVAADAAALRATPVPATQPPPPPSFSRDGTTATLLVPVTAAEIDGIEPAVEEIRRLVHESQPPGLGVWVTGGAGITVDAVKVFGQIDATLLLATTLLILVLLLLIYRSPVVALVPLAVVALAYAIAAGIVYLLIDAFDLVVNGQTTGILIILMFGAGTDYCLLIVQRFRDELHRHEDTHEAMAEAVRRTSPAILSSGGTVVAAMLVLLVADLRPLRSSGPVFALGIGVTMLAGLTLLPALLAILGRRSFWPSVPRVGEEELRGRGRWRRIAHAVEARPVTVLVACVAALGLAAVGNAVSLPGLSLSGGIRGEVESIDGLDALARSLPAGEVAATDVLVSTARAQAVRSSLERVPEVASARRVGTSDDGRVAHLAVTLDSDPYGDRAIGAVDRLRTAARAADPTALVGGASAEEADSRDTTRRDALLVFPLTLAAILAILAALLRAVVAPLYLVASVILSFAATLGASLLAFRYLFDSPGTDASLAVFVFLFVVALGVDYNIFLMARVREETLAGDARTGVIHGLERTGGVITSAGLILAGTFLVLMLLPLEQLFQLGFAVALGILIDTFLVRTLLVPATAFLLGRRSWWPGAA